MEKIKLTTNRYNKLFFPGIFLPMLMILMLVNTGCRKESWIQPTNLLDTSYYFILNMNGKTYNSTALTDRNSTNVYAPTISGIFTNKSDPTGAPINWDLFILSQAEYITRSNYILVRPSTFTSFIFLHKRGDLFGQFNVNSSSYFSDVDGKTYDIDTTASYFTITGMSPPATAIPYIDGTFECIVYEMRNYDAKPIRAYGTFRLKAF